MKPYVVLCMAGRHRRFHEAGYSTPKYLLPLWGRPILTEILTALGPDRALLVANERDRTWEGAIWDAIRASGVEASTLIFTPDTGGPAETAAVGARYLVQTGWTGPVLFHSVDVVVRGRDLERLGGVLEGADGLIDVFPSSAPDDAYVRVADGRVGNITPRVAISRHAITGLFGFRSAEDYLQAVEAAAGRARGEVQVTDVYLALLERGADIRAEPAQPEYETLRLHTPAEYEAVSAPE